MGTTIRRRSPTHRVSAQSDLHAFIREAVRKEIRTLIGDPDYGRPLRIGVPARLARSQQSKRAGKVRSVRDVIARLGLRV